MNIYETFDNLRYQYENEVVEFKKAENNFDFDDLGKYFSALSNEANLRDKGFAWLVFGVHDKSREIIGTSFKNGMKSLQKLKQDLSQHTTDNNTFREIYELEVEGKRVLMFQIPAAPRGIPMAWQGHFYARRGESLAALDMNKYEEIRRQTVNVDWSKLVAENITVSDLNEERIRSAVRLGVAGGRINASAEGDSIDTLLTKFKLLHDGKPTNAAVVLFGNNVDEYPQLLLRMARFKGTDKMEFIDNKRATGNFFDLLDAGMEFCFKHLNLSGKVVGLRREEHLEIPVEALREALTNSLCHRRYDDPRTSVSLAIYDDRLEIVNPGCFTNGLTPENIKDSHESFPYNQLIAQVLYLSTYLESWGSGVRRMIDLCHEQGLPEPEYQADGYTVRIVFWKSAQKKDEALQLPSQKNESTSQKSDNTSQKKFGASQKAIMEMIGENSDITTSEIAERIGIDRRNVQEHIKKLQESGLLHREGGRKNGKWIIDNSSWKHGDGSSDTLW